MQARQQPWRACLCPMDALGNTSRRSLEGGVIRRQNRASINWETAYKLRVHTTLCESWVCDRSAEWCKPAASCLIDHQTLGCKVSNRSRRSGAWRAVHDRRSQGCCRLKQRHSRTTENYAYVEGVAARSDPERRAIVLAEGVRVIVDKDVDSDALARVIGAILRRL